MDDSYLMEYYQIFVLVFSVISDGYGNRWYRYSELWHVGSRDLTSRRRSFIDLLIIRWGYSCIFFLLKGPRIDLPPAWLVSNRLSGRTSIFIKTGVSMVRILVTERLSAVSGINLDPYILSTDGGWMVLPHSDESKVGPNQ